MDIEPDLVSAGKRNDLLLSKGARRVRRLGSLLGSGVLLLITSSSAIAVLFIFYFIAKDAIPFFQLEGFKEFFTSTAWYPSSDDAEFGALAIIIGSAMVTFGAALLAIPLGISAAVCLSDVLSFKLRQYVKPVIEILTAIPSVAYGFFALVVFAPMMQEHGGKMLAVALWMFAVPVVFIFIMVVSDIFSNRLPDRSRMPGRIILIVVLGCVAVYALVGATNSLNSLKIISGANALNASIILGIMALPTVVSIAEDALQAVGRELREGSYALGSTRAETLLRVIIPAAGSGIIAAVILGVMRAVGETMVVWMASGNSATIPDPWFNFLEPVRTLTATIAGDMGEADHVTGSARYHVLFAMALLLLVISFSANLISEIIVRRSRKKLGA